MVARLQVEELENPNIDCLPRQTQGALRFFSASTFMTDDWYLAGGTALALQAGHRRSVDLDFFTPSPLFKIDTIERPLLATKKWETKMREEGTLFG